MPSLRGRSRPKSQADLLSNIKYSLGLKSPAIDFSIYLSISIYELYMYIYTHNMPSHKHKCSQRLLYT